ncbi:hypothetical protein DQ04_10781010 [Trypanosoma grayi]|uniref:hypothetical protein n=1 Tax=Trypanosoma grayi TaxID=71804 RepID=UPI0004F477DA|nr:hypothetical protein DQ04_10781010 [Trypanosoma grayi]KEG07134.1 hypothetical protein DQ04_10781010 [Trypanosoma grayi]
MVKLPSPRSETTFATWFARYDCRSSRIFGVPARANASCSSRILSRRSSRCITSLKAASIAVVCCARSARSRCACARCSLLLASTAWKRSSRVFFRCGAPSSPSLPLSSFSRVRRVAPRSPAPSSGCVAASAAVLRCCSSVSSERRNLAARRVLRESAACIPPRRAGVRPKVAVLVVSAVTAVDDADLGRSKRLNVAASSAGGGGADVGVSDSSVSRSRSSSWRSWKRLCFAPKRVADALASCAASRRLCFCTIFAFDAVRRICLVLNGREKSAKCRRNTHAGRLAGAAAAAAVASAVASSCNSTCVCM